MIKMVQDMGFPTSIRAEPGMIWIMFPASINPVAIGIFEGR
jgi:hypothetical protein